MAQKRVRFIDGREFLLAGRRADEESAGRESDALRTEWTLVRIIKRHTFDYMIYVHGRK